MSPMGLCLRGGHHAPARGKKGDEDLLGGGGRRRMMMRSVFAYDGRGGEEGGRGGRVVEGG